MNKEELIEYFKHHPNMIKNGKGWLSKRLKCTPEDIEYARMEYKSNRKLPKVLIFDIETAPMSAYVWKRYKENVSLDQTISESFMLCWSAKWLYDDKVYGDCVTSKEAIFEDDERIVKSLYDMVKKSDILIAYNGLDFDIPYMNQRFLVYGMDPYPSVHIIDPYRTMKSTFRFSSNKMDHIATELGLQNKIKTDFDLWKGCVKGKKEYLDEMLRYNKQDVIVLEEIYLKVLPWLKYHPNMSGYLTDKDICIRCTSSNISKIKDKYFYTPSGGKYELFRCNDCGSIFRGKDNLNKKVIQFVNCSH